MYTLSDPRAVIGKRFAEQLAAGTEYEAELNLLKSIERLTPEVFAREKGSTKELCANVDMYSGFIYSMMGIPEDLFTPLFACARMAGWAAHRFEEIAAGKAHHPPRLQKHHPRHQALRPDRAAVGIGAGKAGIPGDRTPGFAPVERRWGSDTAALLAW